MAFGTSCAFARQIPRKRVSAPRKNLIFMRRLYAAKGESETALVNQSFLDSGVGVHPTITQEGPVGTMFVDLFPFDFGRHNLFPVNRALSKNFTARRADKTLSPKFNAITAGGRFMADAISRGHKTPISDGMTALHSLPGGKLRATILFLLARVPPNRRRIKQNFGAA